MNEAQNWLLDERVGWRAGQLDHVTTNGGEPGVQLVALPSQPQPLVNANGSFGGFALATGLAVDSEGNIYILDRQLQLIKRYDPCTCVFDTLPCLAGAGGAPRQVQHPSSLAISRHGDLYVVDRGNRRIQIFALKGFPLRAIVGPLRATRDASGIHTALTAPFYPPPDASSVCAPSPTWTDGMWEPYDIALTNECIAYASDYANGLIHVLDASGRWIRAIEPGLEKPTHLALDKECNLYVVQEDKDFVVVLDENGKFKDKIKQPDAFKGAFCPAQVAVDAKGNVYITDKLTRCVNIFCADGCDSFKHAGTLAGSGYGTALTFDSAGNPLACDMENQRIVCFFPPPSYPTEGTFVSKALDSDLYRCEWHRVHLKAYIPPGTWVRVDTFTSEGFKSDAEIASLPESRWATGQIARANTQRTASGVRDTVKPDTTFGENEWDCLIASAPGRYLWLRLTLAGDSSATPRVEWVRVHYPRATSLQYLPAVYAEDAAGRAFLDHYLSIVDTLNGGIGQRIATMARYFDPLATDATTKVPGGVDMLAWLASWLDLALERHWPESRRRQLVKRAHELYRRRGTPEGLRLHVQLYLGLEPRVLEHFRVRRWLFLNHARLGDASALWGADVVKRLQLDGDARIGEFQLTDSGDPLRDPFHTYAHIFTVFVPTSCEPNETQKQTVTRIVEMAKPAHTLAKIEWVQPLFRIGIQSFVGVDTVIGQYPEGVTMGKGQLGYDTVLSPTHDETTAPTMRVGTHTRIGTSTLLD